MAKPLPVAAVVFPKASKASVRLRTSGSKPLISAFPPALSAIGPYASVARVIPSVESIPTAAIPIPYKPTPRFELKVMVIKSYCADINAKTIATLIVITGIAVEIIPNPNPEIITVAGPVFELSATLCVGR